MKLITLILALAIGMMATAMDHPTVVAIPEPDCHRCEATAPRCGKGEAKAEITQVQQVAVNTSQVVNIYQPQQAYYVPGGTFNPLRSGPGTSTERPVLFLSFVPNPRSGPCSTAPADNGGTCPVPGPGEQPIPGQTGPKPPPIIIPTIGNVADGPGPPPTQYLPGNWVPPPVNNIGGGPSPNSPTVMN